MHFRKVLLVVFAVAIATFSVGVRGQGLIDGIKVDLPHPVTIGEKVLEPGEYEIRRPSTANRDILQIFNKDKMVYETNVLTVATGPDDKDPRETKVVLHHIGDAYYFDKIWMEDRNYGWEFPLPDRARALQRETALNVPAARYEAAIQQTSSAQVTPQENPGPGLAAQLDAIAAQQDREQQQAALTESQNQADRERQEQLDRDRQRELDRQAQLDRERAEREQVAALRPEPAPAAVQSEVRETEPQARSEQSISEVPEQLPETATNWLALAIGGCALLALSFVARPARARE